MKLELLTNATVVDDAIRFVAEKSKEQQNICSTNDYDRELNELNYREKLEEDADELYKIASKPTVNKTF
jgi:hypothetical protein